MVTTDITGKDGWSVDFTGNTLVTIKHRDGRVWTFECGECDILVRLKFAMEFIENIIEEHKP